MPRGKRDASRKAEVSISFSAFELVDVFLEIVSFSGVLLFHNVKFRAGGGLDLHSVTFEATGPRAAPRSPCVCVPLALRIPVSVLEMKPTYLRLLIATRGEWRRL